MPLQRAQQWPARAHHNHTDFLRRSGAVARCGEAIRLHCVLLDFVTLMGIDSTSSELIRGSLSPFKVTWSERVNTSGVIAM